MNLSEQLDAARLTLANSDECQKHLFASGEALKAHHAELEAAVVRRLRITQADPTNTQNAVAAVISELHGDLARDLAVTGAAAAALAASEEYAAAHAAIAPRVGDVRRVSKPSLPPRLTPRISSKPSVWPRSTPPVLRPSPRSKPGSPGSWHRRNTFAGTDPANLLSGAHPAAGSHFAGRSCNPVTGLNSL